MKALGIAALLFGTSTAACSMIPVHMHTETHIQHMDGTVEHTSSDWEGTLDQLPDQLSKEGEHLAHVTSKMVAELTDVPPPGNVTLADLHPNLAKYKGQHGVDFLADAKDAEGKPITFQYVKLGAPSYDDFFRTAQEVYAIVYETTQVLSQMRQLAGKILDTKIDATAELSAQVNKAIGAGADAQLTARLKELKDAAVALSILVPALAGKIGQLVTTGEALVTNAATSLTNPKVVAHLGLVKRGLVDSVKVIKDSGGLVADYAKTLTSFS